MEAKMTPSNPGDAIRQELDNRGWTQEDLAAILGRPRPVVTNIILGKTAITPNTAQELEEAFGISADHWLMLEAANQLSKKDNDDGGIRHRAKVFQYAPLRDMQKRGWISEADQFETIENELRRFFLVPSLDEQPKMEVALRTSRRGNPELQRAQIAWSYRCLYLASTMRVANYNPATVKDAIPELRKLAARPELVRDIPATLRDLGIRFLVVQHLPKTGIDGAALWIEDSPILAMSLRYDQIDKFWHTLFHELFHILYRDGYRIDVDLEDSESSGEIDLIEQRANEEAANALIPKEALDSFIRRVSPFYKKEKIVQFANRHKIHPGIILGQLQHRKEVAWRANKEFLVNIRDVITKSALTDGWN